MLIEHYDLDVFTPPREAGGEKYSASARLAADISDVLPYLNATLPGAVYQHAANALTWKQGEQHWTMYANQIAIGNVGDYDLAVTKIGEMIDLINRTWERRAEISPDFKARQRPPLMAVYKLLPQINCRQCGEPTCYAYAIKLAAAQKTLADCPPVQDPQYADQLAALHDLIAWPPATSAPDALRPSQ